MSDLQGLTDRQREVLDFIQERINDWATRRPFAKLASTWAFVPPTESPTI
jgi:ribosome-associated toxin RatA of RatAB toxin-antitoxin module